MQKGGTNVSDQHIHDHEEEVEYLYIPNEDGEEEKFEILGTFEHDETGRKYMMVAPADADEDEEQEVFAFRYTEDGDEFEIELIEDEEEWKMVEEMFHFLFADDEA